MYNSSSESHVYFVGVGAAGLLSKSFVKRGNCCGEGDGGMVVLSWSVNTVFLRS